jgi:hypothetical protein
MKKVLILACFMFLFIMMPVTATAGTYTIDPTQSYVTDASGYYFSDVTRQYSLSGSLTYGRIDNYIDLPWVNKSLVTLIGTDMQSSWLPYGPFVFPDKYYGTFTGSVFDGSSWLDLTSPDEHGFIVVTGEPSILKGTLTDQYLDIYGSAVIGYYISYYFHIHATADSAAAVPEPATMLLLGLGLAGAAVARKKFRK